MNQPTNSQGRIAVVRTEDGTRVYPHPRRIAVAPVRTPATGSHPNGARRARKTLAGRAIAAVVVALCPILPACEWLVSGGDASLGGPCSGDPDCPSGQTCNLALHECQSGCSGDCACDPSAPACAAASSAAGAEGGTTEAGIAADADDAASARTVDADDDGSFLGPGGGDAPDEVPARDGVAADGQPSDGQASDAPADASPGAATATCPAGMDGGGSVAILFGGVGDGGYYLADTWFWDGGAWSKETPTDAGISDDAALESPPGRQSATLSPACGVPILVGGEGSSNMPLADAWLWNGSAWQPAPAPPAARTNAAAATLGATTYLFGGYDEQAMPQSNLFAWDGALWSSLSIPAGPAQRAGSTLSTVPGGLLLFGGADVYGVPFDDTWLFTGTAWSSQNLADGAAQPPARSFAAAATWGDSVILFGGYDANYDTLGDTWIWTGAGWAEAIPQSDGPPGRTYAAMVTLGSEVVLFGGLDSNDQLLGDTWIWNGQWTEGPTSGPGPRYGAAMSAF